jgi:hypothetical protein
MHPATRPIIVGFGQVLCMFDNVVTDIAHSRDKRCTATYGPAQKVKRRLLGPRGSHMSIAKTSVALVLVFLLGGAVLSGCAVPSDTAASTSKPHRAKVPDVAGLDGKLAQRKLEAAGFVVRVARKVPSPRPQGSVLRQLTRAGASVREGSTIALVVAAPYPLVPGTAGMAQAAATQRLRDAGFVVQVTQEVVTSGTEGVVLRQTPIGSRRAAPHSVVTLVVAHVVRPVAQPAPAPAGCTTGYSPCLPPASDYDCAGGSGNGPEYTGLVYVTGSDPYDLDADGDGVACES